VQGGFPGREMWPKGNMSVSLPHIIEEGSKMFTRRTFLSGIKYVLPAVAVSEIRWLGAMVGETSKSPAITEVIPDYAQVLIGIRSRLTDPNNWCQLVYKQGQKRCLLAAMIEELNLREETMIEIEDGQSSPPPDFDSYHTTSGHFLYLAKRELFPDFVWLGLDRWNDDPDTTHDDVLRVVDRAIECAIDREVHEVALERTNWEIC